MLSRNGGISVRKYHLADVLTTIEIIMAVTITGMIFFKVSANWVIWAFVIGELCDAFDGICARRWPYPDDGKHRWWRVPSTVQAIEHISDICLLSACSAFLIFHTNRLIRASTIVGTVAIAAICIIVELQIQTDEFYTLQPERTKEVILWRRKVYLAGIALGVVFLIFATSWHWLIKIGCCLIGIRVGLYLRRKKRDRLDDV